MTDSDTTAVALPDDSPLAQAKVVEELLVARQGELTVLLGDSDIDPEKFIRTTVVAIAKQPEILKCTRASVLLAIYEAAKMGLEPTGAFGGAHLVGYSGKAQLIVDWRGYIKLLLRSGQVRKVNTAVVYEGDRFQYELGTHPKIDHYPTLTPADRGQITHVYAVFTLTDGEQTFEVMTRAEIDAIRGRTRRSGPWDTDYTEMARKTVVRRLAKYVPVAITPQMAAALTYDDNLETEPTEPNPAPKTRRDEVIARLAAEPTEQGAENDGDLPPMDDATGTTS